MLKKYWIKTKWKAETIVGKSQYDVEFSTTGNHNNDHIVEN